MARQPHLLCAYLSCWSICQIAKLKLKYIQADSISKECATVYTMFRMVYIVSPVFFPSPLEPLYFGFRLFFPNECMRINVFTAFSAEFDLKRIICSVWLYTHLNVYPMRIVLSLAAYSISRALYAQSTMLLFLFVCRFILFDWIVLQYLCVSVYVLL